MNVRTGLTDKDAKRYPQPVTRVNMRQYRRLQKTWTEKRIDDYRPVEIDQTEYT